MNIKTPIVIWSLGDPEQSTYGGVNIITRPLNYRPKGATKFIKIGDINPDYSEQLMKALK